MTLKAITALIFSASLTTLSSQMPTLSGKWTDDPRAPQCQRGAGANHTGGCADDGGAKVLCGENLTIDLVPDAIKIERLIGSETMTVLLPLDGTPVKHPVPFCRPPQPPNTERERLRNAEIALGNERLAAAGLDNRMTTTASRDGSNVVLRSSFRTPTGTREQTQKVSLSMLGQLVVETDKADGRPLQVMVYGRIKGSH